ncbi:MAG: FAD-binding protein [Sulfurimonas sp.]|nr:FAD-binding protein [Sulfurimonas sp.]
MSNNDNKVSRREFLGFTGGILSFAAISALGKEAHFEQNILKVDTNKISSEELSVDVLVVGSGMAGLFAAIKAHDAGAKVMMVSKGRLGSSGQTPFAKGIFSYDAAKEKLSIDEFVATVSRSALGTNNEAYTRQLAEYSKARVEELRAWGFFDSPLYNAAFSKPMQEREIPLIERVMITNLLQAEDGSVAGAMGFSLDEEKVVTIRAKSVILCTGAGGFKPNGFPICDLTHDGSIMAYNIGAKITGKEWNDGHPGSATNAADTFGNWHGMFEEKPSTTTVQINHHLGVDLNYAAYASGNSIKMGPPQLMSETTVAGGPYTPEEFQGAGGPPQESEEGERKGPPKDAKRPPGMSASPVGGSSAGLAIHKSEGLTPINDRCESTIKGLYAAGDALGSHMSGGIYTQIGSSLAGSAVQGTIAAEEAAKYSKTRALPEISQEQIATIKAEILAPLKREAGYSPRWITQTLQGIVIPNFVLYIKKERMLQAALAYVDELQESHIPYIKASDMHELRLAHETINMVISAQMKLRASLMRKESRCSHFRLDYPELDNKNWQAWINIYKDKSGAMAFEKQPFGTWAKA